jgi:type II secretory pathway component PulC
VVLGVLSLALAAEAARTFVHLWTLAGTKSELTRPRAGAAPPEQLKVRDLMAAHLFGQAPAEKPAELPARAAARWVLSGTMRGSTPASGAAILGHRGTTTRFRTVGEEVSDGFTLAEVFLDRVTLVRAGERLTLRLTRVVGAEYPQADAELAAADPRPTPRRIEPDLTERPASRPPAYDALRPSLHLGKGRVDGLRVWGTGDGSNLDSYGLQRNDVIRDVDGQAINSVEARRLALDALSQGHPVAVTVERAGNRFTLQLGFGEGGG